MYYIIWGYSAKNVKHMEQAVKGCLVYTSVCPAGILQLFASIFEQ